VEDFMAETQYPAYRWLVLLTLVFATLAQGSMLISFAPLVGDISRQLNLSLGQVTGALMGAFTLFVAVFAIVGGALIDRIGIAKVYVGATLLLVVSNTLILAVGPNFGGLAILRVLEGIACGPIIGSGAAVAVAWFPAKERSLVTGAQGASLTLGTAIGLIMVPAITQSSGGNWPMAVSSLSIFAAIALVLSIVIALGPRPPAGLHEEKANDHEFATALKSPTTYVGILCIFMLSWVMQAFNDLTPGYVAIDPPVGLGHGPVAAGQYMTLVQVGFLLGSALSGLVFERLFKRRAKPIIVIAFGLVALFCLSVKLPFVTGALGLLMVCFFLAGFFQGYVNPTCLAFVATNYPPQIAGKLGGLWMGIGIFGGTVGVLVGSTFLHFTKAYNASLIVVVVVALAGCLVGAFLNPPKKAAK
jgi:MFS family permease